MPRRTVIRLKPRRRPGRPRKSIRPRYFGRLRRSYYKSSMKPVHLNLKRATCGRLMTLYGTAASAGSTCTFNAANNLLSLSTSATNTTHYFAVSMAFCLDDIPNITEFTSLFDMYRINAVALRIYPVATVAATGTSAGTNTNTGGWLHHITDDDDYATLTASDVGIDEIRQYSNYKVVNVASRRPIRRLIRPKISMAAAGGGTFSTAVNLRPKWINSAYTNTTHYGWKGVFEIYDPAAATTNLSFKIEPIYYISLKNLR